MSAVLHTKTCIRCLVEKPIEAFYAHKKARDGRQGACMECVKDGVRSNYRRNRDYYVAYDKRREQEDYRKADKAQARLLHRLRNPVKYQARYAVSNAIRDGRLERQPCIDCGSNEHVHAHHHDYTKAFDVEWLCRVCHWARHGGVRKSA